MPTYRGVLVSWPHSGGARRFHYTPWIDRHTTGVRLPDGRLLRFAHDPAGTRSCLGHRVAVHTDRDEPLDGYVLAHYRTTVECDDEAEHALAVLAGTAGPINPSSTRGQGPPW